MTRLSEWPDLIAEPAQHSNGQQPRHPCGRLYMIGNAHLDPVWLWRWQEGFQAAKATFRSALDRLAECDDFLFTSSSAAIYEWIEQHDPALFAEIAARIAEGRWQIVGGWWIQPDCNLPSGESFVRQALYGQRYFQAKFGVMARVGYNVDSFGHHAMLPQILKQSGLDYYVFTRPEPGEMGLPGRLFWWESDDGSRVLAFRIPFEYASWGHDLERYVRRCVGELKPPFDELMCFYGVGNHGGGPTRENLASIRRMQQDPRLPELCFSTPDRFFAALQTRDLPFPTVHGELQHHASGCYAVHSAIKRWNRQGENLLLAAEKFATLASTLSAQSYPDLSQAWKNLLFNQFHDILAGTCIEAAYEDARDLHGEAMTIGARALNNAVQAIAGQIAIEAQPGMQPIVVFNPHCWPVRTNVEVELNGVQEGAILCDDADCELPLQFVRPAALISGWRRAICFTAELPALGYRVYRVLPSGEAQPRSAGSTVETPDKATSVLLELGRFRLSVDPASGCIASLYDKRYEVEVFRGPAAQPVVIADSSDTWGHGVYRFDDVVGAFTATNIRLLECGPVRTMLRVESAYGTSRLIQDFILYADLDQVDVRVTVDWHEQFKLLKLRFPINLNFLRGIYEIPYGRIERPTDGAEEPGQSWFDLSGIVRGGDLAYGVSILNDGKYSFDIYQHTMSLTVLRSPIYAHHHPTQPQPTAPYTFIDQGVQRFSYTILPHAGTWEQGETVRRAAELNQRPIVLVESFHDGPLPQQAGHIVVEAANIVVGVLKHAEDGQALILRGYETSGAATTTTIRLPLWGREIVAHFRPYAIKTWRIPPDPLAPVEETNLLEDTPG